MESSFKIVSDGSCDLPVELAREQGIAVVPFYVSFDEKTYQKEVQELGVRDFYQRMVDEPACFPKTSMPSVQDYMETFEPWVKKGMEILCICITEKFSGSMQSAVNAKAILTDKYPDAKITVMDAPVTTALQGLFVLEAAKMQREGLSCARTAEHLNRIKNTGRIFFTVGNLEYLKHGGRIGKVASLAGSVLGIRPVILMKDGEIFPAGLGRSRRKTLDKTMDMLADYLDTEGGKPEDYAVTVGFGYDREEAERYRERLLERLRGRGYELRKEEIPIRQIGATIGVHTGPHPIGLGVIRKWDAKAGRP